MRRTSGALLLSGLLASLGAPAQQADNGVVYSYVKDGKRHYTATPPPTGSTDPRAIRYTVVPAAPTLPASAPAGPSILYRCRDGAGASLYTSKPAPGCAVVGYYAAPMTAPRPAIAPRVPVRAAVAPRYWQGYTCTQDCSGHEAGYRWAEQRGIEDPDDCGGNSQSFIEGCEAYAEEVQQQMIEDGDCEDTDEDERCD
ncbi:hypothetical protein [Pseudomonas sp. Hp2]|uniref:hypothetical protein n=1 Tax=Pseudomonas sp. Hp2 TaxID=701189 RepID=UPI00112D8FB1|nr:hypothetical protein [Pseudomonas sp. Hp2]